MFFLMIYLNPPNILKRNILVSIKYLEYLPRDPLLPIKRMMQWAAVKTVLWEMIDPPQRNERISKPVARAAMWGWLPGAATDPPTIRGSTRFWKREPSSGVGRAGKKELCGTKLSPWPKVWSSLLILHVHNTCSRKQ